MKNTLNIYTVLVSYNSSKKDLNLTVKALLRQTSFVVICNNSTFDLIFSHPRIKVLNFGDNLGIARAQTLGMTWAFNEGADFVLQMDQDSMPDNDMVTLLYESFLALSAANYNVGLIGPSNYDRYTKKLHNNKSLIPFCKKVAMHPDFEELDFVDKMISSGSLISKKAFQSIGGMLDELFIDHVDFEYCWRLKANGFLIVRHNKARLAHRSGEGRINFLIIFNVTMSAPIRHYYWFRNFLYLFNRNYVPTYWKFINAHKIIFRILFYPFFLNNGFERLKFMLLGLKDGFIKKMYRIDSIK